MKGWVNFAFDPLKIIWGVKTDKNPGMLTRVYKNASMNAPLRCPKDPCGKGSGQYFSGVTPTPSFRKQRAVIFLKFLGGGGPGEKYETLFSWGYPWVKDVEGDRRFS